MLGHRRVAAVVFCALAAFTVILPTVPGAAAETGTPIFARWFVLDATVTRPGTPPKHLDSKQAAAFIQSWYFATLYGTLTEQKPPASLPVHTFKANERINGGPFTFTGLYVTNGKKAWVGLPKQVIGPGAFVPVPKWYIAPPRAILAWQGKVGPLPAAGVATTTTKPATKRAAVVPETKASGSSAGWVVGGIAVAVLALVAIAVFVRTRRRATPPEPA
jgi:hypothetical protein